MVTDEAIDKDVMLIQQLIKAEKEKKDSTITNDCKNEEHIIEWSDIYRKERSI